MIRAVIVVDECHRGSAGDESNWREILEYFEPAYQLGMTATPLREDNRDTYAYFGNPVYTYSLRQGIEDGFLAPYRVHRVITTWDAAGWRPTAGALFETAVVAEFAKLFYHRGLPPALWYWRSRDGWEVDLLIERNGVLHPVEIKATSTPRPTHAAAILRFRAAAGERAGPGLLVAKVEQPGTVAPGVRLVPWDAL